MTGAELLVRCLSEAGIDVIYGVPGEENTDLMLALEASDIRFVLTRHEQAAAFMASVYGRLTGRPAGCLSTLGPGATNLLTGVADATLDFVPLVAITAQANRERMALSESHQVIDLEALFRPVTKVSQTLMTAQAIPGVVAEALRQACAPRPGAVHLSLPEDVAAAEVTASPLNVPETTPPLPAPGAVLEAIRVLRQAERPVLMVGNGVIRAGVSSTVQYLAEALNIPVVTSFMAAGVLPKEHGLNMFTLGQPFVDHIDRAVAQSDLIVAIGFDPIEYPPTKLTNNGTIPVITLSEQPGAADVGWPLKAEIVGGLAASMKAIAAGLTGHVWKVSAEMTTARDKMLEMLAKTSTEAEDNSFRAEDVLSVVESNLNATDVILSGVGTHKMKVARSLIPKRPGQMIIANGLAGMGLALPGAIAAAELTPEGHVLAICGDGDFLMNVQDMETAARLGHPLTVMVWEDGGYGLIEAKQEDDTDTHTALGFSNPDWGHLAKAFGWQHMPVAQFKDLDGALKTAKAADGPTLLTLCISYSEPLRDRVEMPGGSAKESGGSR
ncbi:acetolactate synthase large subunit [Cognatishimia sp. MH4019]|uniref:acetolactate synthase large subunit n=1 Tax=Cognatishimia sp. MH4019 TaxID=2854030 RepID=UPI001CD55ECB|nr:acetolactate synthase large subunit [Cognatishimia sp. MH4019]